jgi:hypothetical protein
MDGIRGEMIQSACTSTGRNHGYNPRLWIVNPSEVVIHVTTPLTTSLKGCNVHNHGWNPWRDDAIDTQSACHICR